MTLVEARQILGITVSASEEERHAAFYAKQQALTAKISQAPTVGLETKYRTALKQLEAAIELVEASANRELLPDLKSESIGAMEPLAEQAAKAPSSFGRMRLVSCGIVVLLTGVGIWWLATDSPEADIADRTEADSLSAMVQQAEEMGSITPELSGAQRVEDAAEALRAELSYLDQAAGESDVLARLDTFAQLVGEQDADYVRWLDKVLPSVRIKSSPRGAMVLDAEGVVYGQTPLVIPNVPLGEVTYFFKLSGYGDSRITVDSSLNGQIQTQHVVLNPVIHGPELGQPWTVYLDEEEQVELLYVEPGTFTMGSPASEVDREGDESQHTVTLTEGYWLGKYEVTQGQWAALMGSSVSEQRDKRGSQHELRGEENRHPMYYVSWEEAMEFCRRLTERERDAHRLPYNMEYSLPTEAQWEYACRAGTQTTFHYGDHLDRKMANLGGNYPGGITPKEMYREVAYPVGSYQPNAWGFYDMHGNVYEWCRDWYGDYPSGAVRDPLGARTGPRRALRGGGMFGLSDSCRSANRSSYLPDGRDDDLGFRLVVRSVIP